MFTMILLLYLQQHLGVTLEGSSLRGTFASKRACEQAAVLLRGPLPTPDGYAAAWHDVLCVPIGRGVTVNHDRPLDLGRLLQERPPVVCEAAGAWRRVQELCRPPPSGGVDGPPDARASASSAAPISASVRGPGRGADP